MHPLLLHQLNKNKKRGDYVNPTGYTIDFVIPQGPTGPSGTAGVTGATGPTGETGPAPTLTIGTVTTGEPGTDASVTITPTT